MDYASSSSSSCEADGYSAYFTSVSATHNASPHYQPARVHFIERFYETLEAWRRETGHLSSIGEITASPHFAAIIAMGDKVVPNILHELQRGPSFLFLALQSITGENPVPASARGKTREMISAWLAWGESTRADAR